MIKNLTPHRVAIVGLDGTEVAVYPPSGLVARAAQADQSVGTVEGIEVVRTTFGVPTDLPDPEEGTWLIVSLATANAAKAAGRITDDLLLTSNPVRDDGGRIVGCRRFAIL